MKVKASLFSDHIIICTENPKDTNRNFRISRGTKLFGLTILSQLQCYTLAIVGVGDGPGRPGVLQFMGSQRVGQD